MLSGSPGLQVLRHLSERSVQALEPGAESIGVYQMEEIPRWEHKLPSVPHKLFNDAATVLAEFYKEHIRRDTRDGRLRPPEAWDLLRGFLIAGTQTYAAVCILLADKRPTRLLLQAGVLNRALFEIMATIMALLEDLPTRAKVLLRESHKAQAVRYKYLKSRFGGEPKWADYFDVYQKGLVIIGQTIGLPPEATKSPDTIPDEWPTPGLMIYGQPSRKIAPFLSGGRREVLKEMYQFHYPHQSAQAHGRMASMAVALLADDPGSQWNPGNAESDIVATSLLFLACTLSEIEAAGGFPHHPKLAELWVYLQELDDEAKELWALRYQALSGRLKSNED